jgi:hypothetical protein
MFKNLCVTILLVFFSLQLCLSQTISNMVIDTTFHEYDTHFQPKGASYSIVAPMHFKPFVNNGNHGFIHTGSMSSMQIKTIEGVSYLNIAASINDEIMQEQGIKLISKENMVTASGNEGVLVILQYSLPNDINDLPIKFERLMFITGTYHTTFWIDANYPLQIKPLLYNVMKNSMESIQF